MRRCIKLRARSQALAFKTKGEKMKRLDKLQRLLDLRHEGKEKQERIDIVNSEEYDEEVVDLPDDADDEKILNADSNVDFIVVDTTVFE